MEERELLWINKVQKKGVPARKRGRLNTLFPPNFFLTYLYCS